MNRYLCRPSVYVTCRNSIFNVQVRSSEASLFKIKSLSSCKISRPDGVWVHSVSHPELILILFFYWEILQHGVHLGTYTTAF